MIQEKKIFINGSKINYKISGEGSPFLILHGWGGSSDSWIRVQEILAKQGYQVICPDLPGFGKTPNPPIPWSIDDYINFIFNFTENLGLKEIFLIGHSFGGGLAVKFTVKYSNRVKALILSDAAIIRKKRLNLRQRIAYCLAKGGKILFNIPIFKKYLYPLAKKIVYKVSGTYDYYLANGTMKETIKKVFKEDLTSFLTQIKVPTLIIWGKKDKALPFQDGFLIQKIIPNSKIEIIAGADHSPHRKTPEDLAKIILKFVESKI